MPAVGRLWPSVDDDGGDGDDIGGGNIDYNGGNGVDDDSDDEPLMTYLASSGVKQRPWENQT